MVHLKNGGPGSLEIPCWTEKNHLQLPGPVILDPLNWIARFCPQTKHKTLRVRIATFVLFIFGYLVTLYTCI